MRRMITVVSWMTVPLLLASQLAVAESSRATTPSRAERDGAQEVRVTADEIVSVAQGEGAVAQIQIANTPTQPGRHRRVTVHVGKITRQAVGPHAVACIQIPSEEDVGECK